MGKELSEAEEIYYANYGLICKCDLCGNDVSILNSHDGRNYLTFTGKNFYCKKCLAEPSARNGVS